MTAAISRRDLPVALHGSETRLLLEDGTSTSARLRLTELASLLEAAGLTGRGGAGFLTARKLAAVAEQKRRPALVVNAMEGEPLSRKDETLLALAPGLVVDGAEILAHALRAKRVVIGLGAQISCAPLREAIAARGSNLEVRALRESFVAGQESALVSALSGRPALPSDPATPTWRRGLDGRPTMVVNAETVAQVALIVEHGADWFRSAGTPDDPGTFLVSVSGTSDQVIGTGVTEAARGIRLGDALARFDVRSDLIGGVLVGGYHGAWLPASALDTALDRASLAPWGAAPGAGVLHVLDRGDCPIQVTARIVTYLAGQSARQCGPCLNGLPALATTLSRLATVPATPGGAEEVACLAALVDGRGACAHPDGTVRLIRSTMHTFAEHVEAHLSGICA